MIITTRYLVTLTWRACKPWETLVEHCTNVLQIFFVYWVDISSSWHGQPVGLNHRNHGNSYIHNVFYGRFIAKKFNIVGSIRDREVACSTSYGQGSNVGSCVWGTVSSPSSHNPQEIPLASLAYMCTKVA